MELKSISINLFIALWLVGCNTYEMSDAYGQFETDRITVSAQVNGELTSFNAKEGMRLVAGQEVGIIDTTQIYLKKQELRATMRSVRSQIDKLDAQAEVYKSQLATARKELNRLKALQADNAATQQQIDLMEGQVTTLQKQIDAVEVQKQSVDTEIRTIQTRIAQIEDQMDRARISNPSQGTVLRSYANPGELMTQGRPLYELANLEELTLKVYVSGAQLSQIKLGQQVEVLFDKNAESYDSVQGKISWISSEAEFTPQMIQTKEERVTQVYAVEIRVPNPDAKLKIGMPGEVRFN